MSELAAHRAEVLRRTRIPKDYWPPEDAWPYLKPTRYVKWSDELNLTTLLVERNIERGRGQKVAIFTGDKSITYNELSRLSNKLGNSLKKLGIKSGDRVALRLTNGPGFVISDLATQKIGAVVVPMFLLLKASSIEHIGNDAEITTVIVDADWLEEVEKTKIDSLKHIIVLKGTQAHKEKGYLIFEELLEAGEEDLEVERIYFHDVVMVHYTSGTTGFPKGCIQTPVTLLGHVTNTIERAGLVEDDVIFITPPLPFAYGHASLMYAFYLGASCSLMERFTPEDSLKQVEQHKVTVIAGVPTVYRLMLPHMPNYNLSSLRLLMSAGETFTEDLGAKIREALPQAKIFNFYGYTEIWNYIGTVSGVHPPTSLGTPYEEYEAIILDEDTKQEVPQGKVGTIAARGAGACLYWRLPEKQRDSIKDGWFCTDDLAYKDENGVIWFTARDIDIIKSSGYLIAPYEIEDLLSKHPAVLTAGCIGVPDPAKGEIVKAFLKLKPGYEPSDKLIEELEKFAEEKLEKFKVPRRWEFIAAIPTTLSGKTLRRGLKELEEKNKEI